LKVFLFLFLFFWQDWLRSTPL